MAHPFTHLELTQAGGIGRLTLHRGKVNAINPAVLAELRAAVDGLRADASVRAVILTGHGKFFSFGLDVPELYSLPPERFHEFITGFTDLYTRLYEFPKPVVAALNGHAIAGACMLALACDRRLMAAESGRIGLNEITFGSTVFAGSVEMLRACVGGRNAERVLLEGAMYEPAEALAIGLIDRIVAPEHLMTEVGGEARALASQDPVAFASLKSLLRGPVAETMRRVEGPSLREFVEIWYSEATRERLRGIEIRR
jgi:enoyl-CoA hydratase/carnithine racemase